MPKVSDSITIMDGLSTILELILWVYRERSLVVMKFLMKDIVIIMYLIIPIKL